MCSSGAELCVVGAFALAPGDGCPFTAAFSVSVSDGLAANCALTLASISDFRRSISDVQGPAWVIISDASNIEQVRSDSRVSIVSSPSQTLVIPGPAEQRSFFWPPADD